MLRWRTVPAVVGLLAGNVLLLSGCATVDPRRDYERVGSRVADATGIAAVYRPDQDEAITQRVEELLLDGLTADDAVQISLLNNRELQAAFMNVGIARAEVVQSGLFSNPSLSLSLRLPDAGGLANLEMSAAQNIAELWILPARKRAAEGALDQAILELARQAHLIAVDARSAYYRAVSTDRVLEIAEENRQIAQELLDAAQAKQEAGAGSAVDVNLARSELMETELALRTGRLAAIDARSELALLLGISQSPQELHLIQALPDPPTWSLTPERLIELAHAHRLDLQAADHAVLAAAARVKQEKLSVFSNVEVGVGFERNERRALPGRKILADTARASLAAGELAAPEIESRAQRQAEKNQEIETILGPTLELEVPIWDQNQAQIARAEYAWRQAVKLRDGLVLRATQEARAAYERASTRWDVSSYYRDNLLPLRQDNLELSREAYQAGRLPFLSVLEAQRTLLLARSAYVETLRDSVLSLAELERVAGQPVSMIMEPVPEDEP